MSRYIQKSAAKQILDKDIYFNTRRYLYRSLGVRKESIEDKDILEIGPGHGYNAIVNAEYNPGLYEMVEINTESCKNIDMLFSNFKNKRISYKINNCSIDDFRSEQKYDIVICESMLAFLKNKEILLKTISDKVKDDGILILTTVDPISQFFDMTRRLLANILAYNVDDIKKKIELFTSAFKSHTDKLDGFSKIIEEWCYDMFIDNDLYYNSFSLPRVMKILSEEYELFNMASPNLIIDERWYRQISSDYKINNQYKINSFYKNWHNLFHYKVFSKPRIVEKNKELEGLCEELFSCIISNDTKNKNDYVSSLIITLKKIRNNLKNIDNAIEKAIDELITILNKEDITPIDISEMKYFSRSFGRGSQYVSFIKIIGNEKLF